MNKSYVDSVIETKSKVEVELERLEKRVTVLEKRIDFLYEERKNKEINNGNYK